MKTIVCVGGARPNFMKLAPLLASLRTDQELRVVLIHTGQHHDAVMAGQFFDQLGLPIPDFALGVGSGTHGAQTARALERIESALSELGERGHRSDLVLVVGDVNSTLAAALAAAKLGIPIAHLEAGLRSFDRTMPEEINRLATDAISDLLLASETSGVANLRSEGVPDSRIALVGNLMIDSLHRHLDQARAARTRSSGDGPYGVLTLHRPANVDDPRRLRELADILAEISREIPLVFPVHPRTRERIRRQRLRLPDSIHLREPMGYIEFLGLVDGSEVVLTDSGGIQEETTALGIPCLTLRDNTERPATVLEGTNVLAGTTAAGIWVAWKNRPDRQNPPARVPQGWDGRAAPRTHARIREFLGLSAMKKVA